MVNEEHQKPHVLLLITKADIGGAQVHVLNLIKYLEGRVRFTVGCGERDFLTKKLEDLGIEIVILGDLQRSISPWRDIRCVLRLRRVLKNITPDMIHLHSSKAGIVGRLAAFGFKIPTLFTAHGWAFTEGANWKQRCYGLLAEWMMARLSDGIISVSQYDYDLALRYGVRSSKGNWMVHNGVAELQQDKDTAFDKETLTVLNIGRIGQQKNQKLLLQAAAQISREFLLIIVGTGALKNALQQYAKQLKIEHKVSFVENTQDIEPWFRQANIFVLSSNYEGLPLTVLEAMSMGLPVVATDVGGVSEAITHNKNGFLITRGDSKDLANKITQLIDSAELRKQFGLEGRKKYVKCFKLDQMCEDTYSIYERILSG